MKITKPDDVLILLGYHSRGGKPALVVTLGYTVEPDARFVSEQDTWQWLLPQFPGEPFDVALKKRRGTFAVAGRAHAPAGETVASMAVRAQVGSVEKTLHVHGDRQWLNGALGWKPSAPQPFTSMPLDLSRAFGGAASEANPHGIGVGTSADAASHLAAPNVEHPLAPLRSPLEAAEPATFGPLPQTAPSRTRFLGTFDAQWQRTRFPWLPDDTDDRWFDAVPQDQCANTYWRGDETWSAAGMHPSKAQVQGSLPGLRPRLLVRRVADATTASNPLPAGEADLHLDTVWLFPNDERVIVLYRAEIPVASEDAEDVAALGVFTETLAEPAQSLAHWDAVWREQDAPAPAPVTPAPVAAPQAEADALRAAALAKADAFADGIWKELEAGHAEAIAEVAKQMKASNQPFNPADYPFPSRASLAVPAAPVPLSPTFAADLTRDIESSLAAARAEADEAIRKIARESGYDPDKMVALAHNAPKQPDVPVRQQIEKAGLPAADKQLALERLDQFEKAMADLDTQIAQLDADILAMQARNAAASGAAGAAAGTRDAVQQALAQAGVEGRAREALDRDALIARHANGEPLTWLLLEGLDLSGTNFKGADFSHSILKGCRLNGANLADTRFAQASLEDCTFDEVRLDGAALGGVTLSGCSGRAASLVRVDLSQAMLAGCQFIAGDFTEARLARAKASDCKFSHANLTSLDARNTEFGMCEFTSARAPRADFSRARFDACGFDQAKFSGVTMEGATLSTARGTRPDFTQAALRGLRLDSACALQAPVFDRADLADASLQDASLIEATFHEANLDKAFIKNCDLSRTDGWRASARRADFHGSRFTGAYWAAANFMGASLHKTLLEDTDFSGANLHAAETRTATVRGIRLQGTLLTRCRLLEEHAHDR